uniref:(California timema) hypothetical protein n=1 Tax=Timema californicum TaxID=61474 RepID=A0A7R9J994_TIMCA|nr:unnamed protein product [Timema californicum]
MALEIITFDKSLPKRLIEFKDILNGRGERLPASHVKNEWRYNLEETMELAGWNALWKISRQECQELGISFPTFVMVTVSNVDFINFTGVVHIVAVQDSIDLPETHVVPLLHLFPTVQQDSDTINIENTADCLDQFRFFYEHVWMPWDADDDENEDWISNHLETRIGLIIDMKSGAVPPEMASHIRSLIQEGKALKQKIDVWQELLDEEEEDSPGDTANEDRTCLIMESHLRLDQITAELKILENPDLRNLMVRKKQQETKSVDPNECGEVCFVWQGGNVDNLIDVLTTVKTLIQPSACVKLRFAWRSPPHSIQPIIQFVFVTPIDLFKSYRCVSSVSVETSLSVMSLSLSILYPCLKLTSLFCPLFIIAVMNLSLSYLDTYQRFHPGDSISPHHRLNTSLTGSSVSRLVKRAALYVPFPVINCTKPGEGCRTFPSLEDTLGRAVREEAKTIFLCAGTHEVQRTVLLERGLALRGISDFEKTVLMTKSNCAALLDNCVGDLTLERVTLDCRLVQLAIMARINVTLRGCRVVDPSGFRWSQGIVVIEGARLEASGCEFFSLGTAVVVHAGADAILSACNIRSCLVGVLAYGGANVSLVKSSIIDCKEYGIKFETNRCSEVNLKPNIGAIDLLESVEELSLSDCILSGNMKGDIQVVQQPNSLYDSIDSGCSFTEV